MIPGRYPVDRFLYTNGGPAPPLRVVFFRADICITVPLSTIWLVEHARIFNFCGKIMRGYHANLQFIVDTDFPDGVSRELSSVLEASF